MVPVSTRCSQGLHSIPGKSLCASYWRNPCTNEGSDYYVEPGVELRTRYHCAKAKFKCSACTQCCLRSRRPPKPHQFPWCQQHSAGNTTVSIWQPRVPLLLAALDSQVSLSCRFRQASNVRTIVYNCHPRPSLWNTPFHLCMTHASLPLAYLSDAPKGAAPSCRLTPSCPRWRALACSHPGPGPLRSHTPLRQSAPLLSAPCRPPHRSRSAH